MGYLGIVYPSEPEIRVRLPPPRVTTLIIIINAIVYVLTSFENSLVQVSTSWLYWGAFIPVYLTAPLQLYRLITSMFMHANLFHIFFNMLYLYFFGKSVESVLGGKRYLALYLASGLVAEIFHTAFIPVEGYLSAVTPAVGASGAISGVLGAYLLLFPGSRLTMCFFYLYFPVCLTLNAAAYLIF
ncbi:MAG: rhomboid family intramembrane serine protease, partial [Thermoprotei archaeon]